MFNNMKLDSGTTVNYFLNDLETVPGFGFKNKNNLRKKS